MTITAAGPPQVAAKTIAFVLTTSDAIPFCNLTVDTLDGCRKCDLSNGCPCAETIIELPCGGFRKTRNTCSGVRPNIILLFTFDMAANNRAMVRNKHCVVVLEGGSTVDVKAVGGLCRMHITMG